MFKSHLAHKTGILWEEANYKFSDLEYSGGVNNTSTF